MKTLHVNRKSLLAVAGAGLLALAAACSSDSPSEPSQTPAPPPGGPGSSTFNITVTVTPDELSVGADEPAVITIDVRRADNGQAPPNGTTVAISTSLGDLQAQGSGTQSGFATLAGGRAQVLLFAGEVAGSAVVQARLEGSIGQDLLLIRDIGTFFVSFLSPSTGNPSGGDVVEVRGGGFQEPVRVLIDGVVAQVQSVSDSTIRVVTPPAVQPVPVGTTRTVTVQVTINLNEQDQATDTLAGGFTFVPGGGQPAQPSVFSVSPASGVNEGGTRVTIVGDGFEAPVQVLFGSGTGPNQFSGVEAVVQSVTRTQVVVTTPSATGFGQGNQNQLVDILIRNLNSGFATIFGAGFQYGSQILITAVSPNDIPWNSQSIFTIDGQGFDEPVAVSVAGIAAAPRSVTGTRIVAEAPIPVIEGCTPVSGPVRVVNIESGAAAESDFDFTFRPLDPTVTGLSPISGSGTGGTTVTISGVNFESPMRVIFGDSAGSVSAVTPTSISVITPSFSDFEEEGCDDNDDGTVGMRFVPTSVDVEVINLLTDCNDLFTGGFTYTPTDTSCRGDVAMDDGMP